jgi:hypothetical protein
MLIYHLSGSFVVPFIVAAMGFAWASWQMSRLRALTDSKSPAA